MPIESGSRLGPYEILSPIGAGGMGEVYRARDRRLERDVAVKILPQNYSAGSRQLQRFEREARLLAAISHPNICAIYDVGTDHGISFIVMEHLLGETLAARIHRGPIAMDVALRYAIQIVDGLRIAHNAGLIHRDIKPGNIMITTTGLKVLDFGLAKRSGQDVAEVAPGHTGQTTRPSDLSAHEGIVGTLHYMAPEQLAGGEVDARSDIWAFGCVLFEMITGRKTFEGKTFSDVIAGIMADRPIVLALERGLAPVALERVVQRCLARNPADRFQTTTDLWRELFALLKQSPSDALPIGATRESTPQGAVKPDSSAPKSNSGTRSVWDQPPVELPQPPAEPQAAPRSALWKAGVGVGVVVTLMAAGISAWWVLGPKTAGASVAVLPFEATVGTSGQYLSNGLAGGVADGLSRIGSLQVVPFGVASRSGGSPADAGRTLGVDRVVTGNVTAKGDRIDVAAQLLEVASGKVLWSGRFSGPPSDLVPLQREVIQGVMTALALEGSSDAALSIVPSTMNADAYRLILQARHAVSLGTESSLTNAIDLFGDAIAKDSNAALAHAGFAEATIALASAVPAALRPGDAFPKAKQAATRAINLNPSVGRAQASLAVARSVYDWDWQNAGAGFDRAIEFAPADPVVRERRSEWRMSLGRTNEALEDARKAVQLDPRSPSASLTLGSIFFGARQYADAIEQLKTTLRLTPEAPAVHYMLGMAYEQSGRHDEAIQALQAAVSKSGEKPVYVAGLAYVNARARRTDDAKQMLTRLRGRAAREYVSPYDIALIFAGLDDRDAAIAQLEMAVDEHAAGLASLAVDPRLDRIRTEPQFIALQKRVGL